MYLRKQKYLTLYERIFIEDHLRKGLRAFSIAKLLDRPALTVYRDIKLNSVNGVYNGLIAHETALARKKKSSDARRTKFSESDIQYMRDKLKEGATLGYLCSEFKISTKTLSKLLNLEKLKPGPKPDTLGITDRLCALEDQMKLLFEIIKELRNATIH